MINKVFKKIHRNYYWYVKERYFQNYIFIHINKTGGTSIEKALNLPLQHRSALDKKNYLGEEIWSKKFSFAFVRNPWDKVVSHFTYRLNTNQIKMDSEQIEFKKWVRLSYLEKNKKYYDNPKMFMPQMDWISDENGKVLVNFIGRFENIESDFNEVCSKLNITASLPHLKKSNRVDYKEYYNIETAEIIGELFKKDIEYFNYRFLITAKISTIIIFV